MSSRCTVDPQVLVQSPLIVGVGRNDRVNHTVVCKEDVISNRLRTVIIDNFAWDNTVISRGSVSNHDVVRAFSCQSELRALKVYGTQRGSCQWCCQEATK